jgi:hypothetical protein
MEGNDGRLIELQSRHLPGGTETATKICRTESLDAETRSKHLTETNRKCYHNTNFFRETIPTYKYFLF